MVVELTTGNFDKIVGKDKYVVAKFYTKWCMYCKLMAPEYEKLYDLYENGKRKDVIIARIEAGANEEIAQRYEIYSFPMVIIFSPKSSEITSVFRGRRVASDFKAWIEQNAPIAVDSTDEDEPEEDFLDSDDDFLMNFNNTEVIQEIEGVKKEIIGLQEKMTNLEDEIKSLKVLSNNGVNNNFNETHKEDVKFVILHNLRMPTVFEMAVGCGAMLTLMAVIMTFRKLIQNKKMNVGNSHHAKV